MQLNKRRLRHSAGRFCALFFALALFAPLASAEEQKPEAEEPAALLNRHCVFVDDLNGGEKYRLSDYSDETRIMLSDTERTVTFPQDRRVANVALCWLKPPQVYAMQLLSADGAVLFKKLRTDEAVRAYVSVPEDAAAFRLRVVAGEGVLSELHALGPGVVRWEHLWEPPHERADLLFIVTHADDEHVMMGGIIPTYAVERGLRVQVVYCRVVTHTNNYSRIHEALNGLRSNGMYHCPIFLPTSEESNTVAFYTEALTGLIRRFRPSVVVTHDIAGEYGNNQHRLVSEAAGLAVVAAADAAAYPDSAERYGPHQTLKFYRHLGSENLIRLDFDHPIEALGGKTAFELAFIGYESHQSQRRSWADVLASNRYDCRVYSLITSQIGPDVAGDDFFENVPPEAYTQDIALATPEPGPTPAPRAVEAVVPATPEIEAPLEAAALQPGGTEALPVLVAGGIAAAFAAAGVIAWWLRRRRRNGDPEC